LRQNENDTIDDPLVPMVYDYRHLSPFAIGAILIFNGGILMMLLNSDIGDSLTTVAPMVKMVTMVILW
jgi:hypothetical protein